MGLTVLASVYTYVEEECSNPFNLIVVCSKSFFSTLVFTCIDRIVIDLCVK